MEDNYDKIQELIEQFDFYELNVDQKNLVIAHISESEYHLRRNIVVTSEEIFGEEEDLLAPDIQIKANLQDALSKKNGTSKIVQLTELKMPVYQVVAAAILLLICFTFLKSDPITQYIEKEKIVYEDRVDTVFVDREIEKIVEVPKYITQIKYLERNNENNIVIETESTFDKPKTQNPTNQFALKQEDREEQLVQSFGNTAYDKEVMEALVFSSNDR